MTKTNIAWATDVWNPTTGCDRVSPGCANCYALTLAKRLKAMGSAAYQQDGGPASGPGFGLTLHPERLDIPLHWRKPRRVFVNSMSDLFHEQVPDEFIAQVFSVMARCQQHSFLVLTKRPERMQHFCSREAHWWGNIACIPEKPYYGKPLPNVWLGVSAENQHWADKRIPLLLETPAAVRFVSVEPMLGPVDLRSYLPATLPALDRAVSGARGACLDWVIVGGESGPHFRPMDIAWARSLREQCRAAGIAFFGKQTSGRKPGMPLPEELGDQEFPR